MKLILIMPFLFLSLSLNAQENQYLLVNKTFAAKIGSICEETPNSNPCAGQEVYLSLKFNKKKVTITEMYISSCDKESISYKLEYHWKLFNKNEIKICSKPEEVKYKSIENMKFKIIDKIIFGYNTDSNNKIIEYKFINRPKK